MARLGLEGDEAARPGIAQLAAGDSPLPIALGEGRDGAADAERASLEVDVAPAQAEDLARA